MKLSHGLLVHIIRQIQPLIGDGVCHGFAMVLSQFICMGREEAFFNFLNKIESFATPEHLLFALNVPTREYRQLKNFFKEIAHYQEPDLYKGFFGGIYGQQQIEEISEVLLRRDPSLFPDTIKQIPFRVVYKKTVILNWGELTRYFDDLRALLEQVPDIPISILIGNCVHKLCIKYDCVTKGWFNRDIALLKNDNFSHNSLTTSELAEQILFVTGAFSNDAGFTLSLVVDRRHAFKIDQFFAGLSQSIPSLNEQIRRGDLRSSSLLELAEANDCMGDIVTILQHPLTNPNRRDQTGNTLLHNACSKFSLARVYALLSHPKIRPYELNSAGKSPLAMACMNRSIGIVSALLRHPKICPNTRDNSGLSPLEKVIELGCIEMARDLLAHPRTRPNERNSYGYSPLDLACSVFVSLDIIKALLAHNLVNPNEWDRYNQTPLHTACINQSPEVINVLLSCEKVNPNAVDSKGFTALDRACMFNNLQIVRALLAHPKTCSRLRSFDGLTPLDRARYGGAHEIEQALLAHGGRAFERPRFFHSNNHAMHQFRHPERMGRGRIQVDSSYTPTTASYGH